MPYPNSFDNLETVVSGQLITALHENNQANAVNAIEQTLGLFPSGPYPTVAAAIAAKLDLSGGTMTGSISMGGNSISNLGAPTVDADAATKAYVDAARQTMDAKDSVRVATTASITLSGTQSVDGVALSPGDRVLVKDQVDASENGIYVVSPQAWSRAADASDSLRVTSGMQTYVSEGLSNAMALWVLSTADPITLGTTPLTYERMVVAGDGLIQSGNRIHVGAGSGIAVNADDVQISPTYPGQSSITTLGVITSGTWQATGLDVPYGGSGRASAIPYTPICGGTTESGAHQSVASLGNSGDVLTSNGPGQLPSFQPPSGGGGASGWTDDGTVVRLSTASDQVGIGTAVVEAGVKVKISGGSLRLEDATMTSHPSSALVIGSGGDGTARTIVNPHRAEVMFQKDGGPSLTPTHFATVGMALPDGTLTDDFIVSTFVSGDIQRERLRVVNSGSASTSVKINSETTLTSHPSSALIVGSGGDGTARTIVNPHRAEVMFQKDGGPSLTPTRFATVGMAAPDGTLTDDFIVSTFATGDAMRERLRVTNLGNVVPGTAALATSATDGFVYMQSMAGAPSGTPTSYGGRVPFVYDTTNDKLYVYNGAWKSVALA